MAFQYKLEALRKYRQLQEDHLQKELFDSQRIMETAKIVLEGYIAKRSQCEETFRQQLKNGASASETAMYPGYLQRLTESISAQSIEVQKAEKICEQIRCALMEAMKKRKMLDRLKEKGEQAFYADMNSREQKFISEMAISRFTLNSLKE